LECKKNPEEARKKIEEQKLNTHILLTQKPEEQALVLGGKIFMKS
jgi:hypothetical protein